MTDATRRQGVTLVELLVTVLLIAIVTRLAIPAYQNVVYAGRAAAALADIHAIQVAAYQYNADTRAWPGDAAAGIRPEELNPYLPGTVRWASDEYRLDWQNWELPDGAPGEPDARGLLAISFTTDDARLDAAIAHLVGQERVHFALNRYTTFIIAAM